MFFGPRKIRYFQKCLISPALEIILTLTFLISFFIMLYLFIKNGKNLNSYQLTEIISEEFQEENFKKIKTKQQFLNYIEFLVNHLYEFDSINKNGSFPYYIPYGSIRLRKYKNIKCTEFYEHLNKSIKCLDEKCTLDFLKSLEDFDKCEDKFKNGSGKILGKFEGKYNKYDLTNEGEFIDFNIEDYYFDEKNNNLNRPDIINKDKIKQFILDPNSDIKFLSILFNVFFPMDKVYGNVICGIEMTNYRNEIENPYNIFSSSIFCSNEKANTIFIFFHLIFFITSLFNLLKIIFEIHSLFICSVHLTLLFSEILNVILIVVTFFYYTTLAEIPLIDLNSENYLKDINLFSNKFIDFNTILNLKGYIKISFSIIFLTVPLKIISLFSWYTTISRPFVQFLGLITRLTGLFLVNAIFFFGFNYTFIEMNHNFYKDDISYFQNIYSCMIRQFFFDTISIIKEAEYTTEGGGINHLFNLSYYLIFNCAEKIFMVYFIMMIISSFVNSFEKASQYEIDKEEDEILMKIKDIEEKLENEEENTDNNIYHLKKQILWLNMGNKNDIFNNYSNKSKKMLFFSTSNQVISFLKYLFAIKPEMQFKYLRNKIGIVIQDKSNSSSLINEKKVNNLFILLDWLNFVGCKIPILIYTEEPIEKNLRMKLSHDYIYINFTNTVSVLESFIKGNDQDDEDNELEDNECENKKYCYRNQELKIVKATSFILYKISYLNKIKNKNRTKIKKSNTKSKRKSVMKYNTNCNLHNMINQIEKINNRLILQRKENESLINQKMNKEKENILNLQSFDDIDESNKESD